MYSIALVDNGFWRAPRPTEQQLVNWKLTMGLGAVLNLDGDPKARAEESVCAKLGIDELYLGLSGITRPTPDAVMEGLKYILANQRAGIPVLVHCLHGVDRTGIVCGGYRVKIEGWEVERAWQEALGYGLHWLPYFWWRKTLEELKG